MSKQPERRKSRLTGVYSYETREGRRWGAIVERERDWKTGKRRPLRKHGFRTQEAAYAWRVEQLDKRRRGEVFEPSMIPLGQWCEEWISGLVDRRPKSIAAYRNRLALINAELGSVPISRLTPAMLDARYAALRRAGYAPSSIAGIHHTLKAALRKALEYGMILRNPAVSVQLPALDQRERPSWTLEQMERFLAVNQDDPDWGLIWRFMAETWVRVGELIDLRWAAVDFENRIVRIERTITADADGKRVSGQPKTKGSRRQILISDELAQLLRQHRDRSRFGRGKTDLVFPAQRTGEWLQQPAIAYALDKACARADVPRLSPHGIRHTGGSLAYAAGVPLKVISERLGHANATITHNVYVHSDAGQHRTAAEQIAALLHVS